MKKSKLLSLDPGSKNIGIALSDKEQIAAFAKETVSNNEAGLNRIKQLVEQEDVKQIILGLPLTTDQHHPSLKLQAQLQNLLPNTEIISFNEDYSTTEAIDKLKQAGFTPEEIQAKKDSMSAQVILEKYMTS